MDELGSVKKVPIWACRSLTHWARWQSWEATLFGKLVEKVYRCSYLATNSQYFWLAWANVSDEVAMVLLLLLL